MRLAEWLKYVEEVEKEQEQPAAPGAAPDGKAPENAAGAGSTPKSAPEAAPAAPEAAKADTATPKAPPSGTPQAAPTATPKAAAPNPTTPRPVPYQKPVEPAGGSDKARPAASAKTLFDDLNVEVASITRPGEKEAQAAAGTGVVLATPAETPKTRPAEDLPEPEDTSAGSTLDLGIPDIEDFLPFLKEPASGKPSAESAKPSAPARPQPGPAAFKPSPEPVKPEAKPESQPDAKAAPAAQTPERTAPAPRASQPVRPAPVSVPPAQKPADAPAVKPAAAAPVETTPAATAKLQPVSLEKAETPEPAKAPVQKPEAQAVQARPVQAPSSAPAKAAASKPVERAVARLPKHIKALAEMDADEVAQNSYKRGFRQSRGELLERLLDPPITLEDAARILNVCPTTVRRYTNRGILPHFRTAGNQRRFRLSDVIAFMESQGGRARKDADEDEDSSGGEA